MKHIKHISNFLVENKFDDNCDLSKHSFNTGDCDIYAVSLHRLYGYPLCAIRGKFLEPEWGGEREFDYEYCHVMVKLPNGNYLDSDGEQTEEEMISRSMFMEDVESVDIVEVSEEDALSLFSCEDQEESIKQVMKYISEK